MISIATTGPQDSHTWQAARQYIREAEIKLYPRIAEVIAAFEAGEADFAVLPIYNTREGEIKDIRIMEHLKKGYWIDNVVLPIHLSLGALPGDEPLDTLVGTGTTFKQCEEFIAAHYPTAALLAVPDLEAAIATIKSEGRRRQGVIETEKFLSGRGLAIREREVAPHNRTRFAILGPEMTVPTGYDATTLVTVPMKDRVGLLFDIMGAFSQRAVSVLDMHSENDLKSQKLKIYIELEGHVEAPAIQAAIHQIERQIIQEPHAIKVLGSYPRVDMRVKHIKSFGFIGSGDMSRWFADRLTSEGYRTLLCGRNTPLRPEEMIPQVEVVAICVPISATPATISTYGPLLRDGQVLLLLAGEAENNIDTALRHTRPGVEVMLVHNLWGPQAATMKDKNVSVVRTARSGALCSEFEAFLYKHGADISHDLPAQHDLLMGVGQKLPTSVSVALAMALKKNRIDPKEIGSHSTLTSLYGIMAMARVHSQNPRTYAEILAAKGKGQNIVRDFVAHLTTVLELAEAGKINELCALMEESRDYLGPEFLAARMGQALAVDETLGRIIVTSQPT